MLAQLVIFGIAVHFHASFFLTGILLWLVFDGWDVGWAALPIAIVVSVQSFFCHEMGHAGVARAFGLKPRVHLLALRSLTDYGSQPVAPARALLISLAGPLVGIAIGLPVLFLAPWVPESKPLMVFAFQYFVGLNLGWAVLSLVPVLPLDGGLAIASLLQLISRERGLMWARYVSLGVLALLGTAAVFFGWPIVLLALAFLVFANVRGIRLERELRRAIAERGEAQTPGQVLESGDPQAIEELATRLYDTAGDTLVRDEAVHLHAWGQLLAGNFSAARQWLDRLSGERDPDPALDGAISLGLGDAGRAVELFEQALVGGPSSFIDNRYPKAVEAAGAWDRVGDFLSDNPESISTRAAQSIQAGAYQAGRMDIVFQVGRGLFAVSGEPLVAFNVACALCRLERFDEALGWLDKARVAGFRDLALLDRDEDLEPLRRMSQWTELRQRFEER